MMDNMIISGIRIYFPKTEDRLPAPEKGMRTFAITVADSEHFRLFAFVNSRWIMMGFLNSTASARLLWVLFGRVNQFGINRQAQHSKTMRCAHRNTGFQDRRE